MKNILILLIAILCGFLVYDLWFAPHHEAHYFWQKIKGFPIFLSIIGSILLMVIAKSLGHFFLYRKEDYYD